MKKSDELRKTVDELQAQIENLQQEGKTAEAKALVPEMNNAVAMFKAAKEMEAADFSNFSLGAKPAQRAESRERIRNRAFNKLLFGKRLTDEERLAYYNDGDDTVSGGSGTDTVTGGSGTDTVTGGDSSNSLTGQIEGTDSKGGYLVPVEQMPILREFRKAYAQLKDYCHVVQANSTSGKWPTLGEESGLLVNFTELDQIQESDFEFGQASYSISDYGDIIPVSNQLIKDANVNILGIVGQRLARKAVNTENSAILSLLSTGLTNPSTISNYKGLTKALNVDLDPIYYANTKIFTNQDGFQWMSELQDAQNRPLLVPDVTAPDTFRFRGKPVVVLPNSVLASSAASGQTPAYAPFYIGNMADYVMFFERQGVEIAVSTEYLFGKYGTALRCVVRFGVAADDTSALKAYKVALSS
jgi:HK97 family phage major capsid protein